MLYFQLVYVFMMRICITHYVPVHMLSFLMFAWQNTGEIHILHLAILDLEAKQQKNLNEK